MTIVGSETKRRRVRAGLSQKQLANLVGVARGTLALHESAGRRLSDHVAARLDSRLNELTVTKRRSIEAVIAEEIDLGIAQIRANERECIRVRLGGDL